ncbi:MAG TPA: protein kinase [Pyrinomonadaceae bacterium]|nr:protein kinase [Pyrinomonadaceae bacterium]
MPLPEGTRLGRYEIRSQLGAGGMGEVYLAQDTELGRAVAIKILPADVAADQQRMNRFVQEARAASALSHPNILAIHEIGWEGATRFIAMEYVEGETLRQRMARAPMKLGDLLDAVIQTASALSAAHAAGVVHRDVKPDNIMLRADGYVKVLDFGLAKLARDQEGAHDAEAPTRALVNTNPGTVMGTIVYMSPEQARGHETDARADVWSLGVVLYEMITGRQPFAGETSSHVIVSILEREPPPLARYVDGVPEALEWIVAKALTKDRDERYQTAREMLNDLRRLKQRLEFAAEMERSIAPGAGAGGMGLAAGDSRAGLSNASGFVTAARTSLIEPPRRTAQEDAAAPRAPSKSRAPRLLAALAALLIAALAAVPAYRYASRRWFANAPRAAFQSMKLTRLTNTGRASIASISPDGKYVVHASEEGERQSLWIRQVATASNVQIIPPAEVHYQGLTFSPDGNYVYYVAHERNNSLSVVYRVPVLGGTPKQIAEDADSPAAVSPDGKRLAFIRNYPGRAETALVVVPADGGGSAEQTLAARRGSQRFDWGDSLGPSWSPDGKLIACPAAGVEAGVEHHTVVAVSVADGAEARVTAREWSSVGQVAWLSGGEGLVFVAAEQAGAPSQVWRVSYPAGEAQRVTNDLNNYTGVSTTAESGALVTVQAEVESRVWVAPGGDARGARQITNGKDDGSAGLAWTPDGAVVYTSDDGGDSNLWSVDAAGARKQLTSDGRLSGHPAASPDGRYIFFVSNRSGAPHVWRINADGSNPKQLTGGAGGTQPSVSPDGNWIVYFNFECNCLWKVSAEGGGATPLTGKLSGRAAISPDGKLVACTYRGDANANYYSLALLSFDDGRLVRAFDIPPTSAVENLRWTPDGRGVAYADTRAGVSNVRVQPTDGGAPRQLTDFKTDHIFSFDWSRDGRQLAVARGTRASDVVLINDLK